MASTKQTMNIMKCQSCGDRLEVPASYDGTLCEGCAHRTCCKCGKKGYYDVEDFGYNGLGEDMCGDCLQTKQTMNIMKCQSCGDLPMGEFMCGDCRALCSMCEEEPCYSQEMCVDCLIQSITDDRDEYKKEAEGLAMAIKELSYELEVAVGLCLGRVPDQR